MTIRERWRARVRAGEQRSARDSAAARQRGVSRVRGLRELTDDELIAQSPVRTSLSTAHHEMEMQRRLKEAIRDLMAETRLSRRSSDRWSLIIAVLTAVIVALTVVLALSA